MKRSTSINVVLFVLIFSIVGIVILKDNDNFSMNNKSIYIKDGRKVVEDIVDYLGFDMKIYPVKIEDRGYKDIVKVLKSNIYWIGDKDFYGNSLNEYLIFLEKDKEGNSKFKVLSLSSYLNDKDNLLLSGKINEVGDMIFDIK